MITNDFNIILGYINEIYLEKSSETLSVDGSHGYVLCFFFLFIQGNVSILKNVPTLPKQYYIRKWHVLTYFPGDIFPLFTVNILIRSQQFSQRELSQPVAAPRTILGD